MIRSVVTLTTGLALLVILAGCGSGPGSSADESARAPREDLAALGDVFEKTPLPPKIKEFVVVDRPGQVNRSHLGACTTTVNDQVNDYVLSGWHLTNGGYTYKVNTSTFPTSVRTNGTDAIDAAFATWNAADSDKKFFNGGTTGVKTSKLDGTNLVAFGWLQAGVIAVTRVWYYTSTGNVAEADMIFNSRYPWAIFDSTKGECQSNPDAYDLQNIATHEAGHVVGLSHPPSNDLTKDLTMYAYGAGGELKKRTLGLGDTNGANVLAP